MSVYCICQDAMDEKEFRPVKSMGQRQTDRV